MIPPDPPVQKKLSSSRGKAVVLVLAILLFMGFLGFYWSAFMNGSSGDAYTQSGESSHLLFPTPPPTPITSPIPFTYNAICSDLIEVGSVVTIQEGAVYGGLTAARGRRVPVSQLSPITHVVIDIRTHNGDLEALLEYINSWVALRYLYLTIIHIE